MKGLVRPALSHAIAPESTLQDALAPLADVRSLEMNASAEAAVGPISNDAVADFLARSSSHMKGSLTGLDTGSPNQGRPSRGRSVSFHAAESY